MQGSKDNLVVANGANRSAAIRHLKGTGKQGEKEGRVEETQTTWVKKKADREGARGQGFGAGGGGSVSRRAGFCILERSNRAKGPL